MEESVYTVEFPAEKQSEQTEEPKKKQLWSNRNTFALMSLLGQCIVFMNRNCLAVTIVAMVSHPGNSSKGEGEHGDVCPAPPGVNDTVGPDKDGEFDWDEQLQGLVLGAYFYGYISSCFIGGIVTEYFGGRLLYGISIASVALLNVLAPVSARTSVELLIANKVLAGMFQGPMNPSLHSMMASRIPPHLRAKYNSIVLTGTAFGNFCAMGIGGILASSNFLGGWPSVFYVFGGAGILWGILWFLLVKEEKIETNDPAPNNSKNILSKLKDVKFKTVLTSPAFLSLVLFNLGDSYGYQMLSSEVPTYLNNIQYFDIDKSGLLSSLPYILQIIFSVTWGTASNKLIVSGKLSILASRRISTGVGMYGAGLALIAMCFVNCNSSLAVAVLCISVAITGASNSGGYLGEQDMCPRSLVGVIKGMITTVSATTGFIAPLITGSIISGNETIPAWRTAFLVAAVMYIIPATIYLLFVTDKPQPWIKSQEKKTEKERF